MDFFERRISSDKALTHLKPSLMLRLTKLTPPGGEPHHQTFAPLYHYTYKLYICMQRKNETSLTMIFDKNRVLLPFK
jgi:hypothetical protein